MPFFKYSFFFFLKKNNFLLSRICSFLCLQLTGLDLPDSINTAGNLDSKEHWIQVVQLFFEKEKVRFD